jgi:hypothetical protein
MAIPKDTLQVSGAAYTRTFDLRSNGNGHTQQQSEMDRPEKILEVTYPHGNLGIIRPSGNQDYVMIQNSLVIPSASKKGRRGKRALLHLDFNGRYEERWYEDGTLIYVPNGSANGHGTPPFCKISVVSKEENDQQEYVITFTSSGNRPPPPTQSSENSTHAQDSTSPNPMECEKNAGQGTSNNDAQLQRIKQVSETIGEKRKRSNDDEQPNDS